MYTQERFLPRKLLYLAGVAHQEGIIVIVYKYLNSPSFPKGSFAFANSTAVLEKCLSFSLLNRQQSVPRTRLRQPNPDQRQGVIQPFISLSRAD